MNQDRLGNRAPKRRFGQHFLHDHAIIERIVSAIAPRPGQRIVEIGPGRGALTWPLLRALGEIDVVELDRGLAHDLLHRGKEGGTLRVHVVDALEFDFCSLCPPGGKIRLVGNLPYNISTPLLFHLLTQLAAIEDLIFMLQREVAERLTAAPGGRQYGRLSVMIQYRCRVENLFGVPPGAFYPVPKVHSSVVRLLPHIHHPATFDESILDQLVRRAFSLRRKTLRNALKGYVGEQDLHGAEIDPDLRAERLSVAQFVMLANRVAQAARPVHRSPRADPMFSPAAADQ